MPLGVNFRDILIALGMLNKKAVERGYYGHNLGGECAGVVTKIGHKVSDIAVGDRVVAMAKNSYSTYLSRNPIVYIIISIYIFSYF
jgi:phthiocerol/phenolphthiocerol synthesis type-I polyketide synthase C